MPRKPKPEPPKRRRRGSGSIVQLHDGSLLARVPANLDKRRPSREFPPGRRDLAEAWLDAYLHPHAVEAATAPLTLGEWTGAWWQAFVEPVRAPNSARWALYALRQLAPLYGTPMAEIRPSALQAIVGALGQARSPATIQAIVGVWRRCLEAAVDDELIAKNPARRLVIPKTTRTPPARHVTPQEVAILSSAIVGHRFEAAYALMLGCGLRIGEILGLAWADVHLAERRAWIGPQYTNGHWRPTPKAGNPHAVPLPSFVVVALIRHRDAQPEGSTLVMQSPYRIRGRRRVPAEKPRPWSAQIVNKDLAALCRGLGIEPFSIHAGRHGLATHLMQAGIAPPVIAERLGNTPGVVLNRYGHATAEGRQQASDATDAYLGNGPGDAEGAETG